MEHYVGNAFMGSIPGPTFYVGNIRLITGYLFHFVCLPRASSVTPFVRKETSFFNRGGVPLTEVGVWPGPTGNWRSVSRGIRGGNRAFMGI